jgi:hypothetical protein
MIIGEIVDKSQVENSTLDTIKTQSKKLNRKSYTMRQKIDIVNI